MIKKKIPLHEPHFISYSNKYLLNCTRNNWVSSSGSYVDLFEKKMCDLTKSNSAVAVLNGTIGLQLSLILSQVKHGEEVIVPTITFIATVNAIIHVGANPIFVDTEETLNIDEEKCIKFIKKKTYFQNNYTYNSKTGKKIKALFVVHTFGNAAKFEKLYTLCKKRNIKIIEDAAESIGTKYLSGKFKNKHTGTIGDFGVISFNGNKTITTGNGGVILFKNRKLAKRAKYLITQAKDNSIKFIHNDVGYNFKLSNLSAAMGVAQLEKLKTILKMKKKVKLNYKKNLSKIKGLKVMRSPDFSINNNWLNILEIDSKYYKLNSLKLLNLLNKHGIMARAIWRPNHLQKPYKDFQRYNLDTSMKNYKNYLCLPSSPNLSIKTINFITNILKKGVN